MAINAGHSEIGHQHPCGRRSKLPEECRCARASGRALSAIEGRETRAWKRFCRWRIRPIRESWFCSVRPMDMQHQYAKSIEYLEKANATGRGTDFLRRQIAVSNLQAGNLDTAIDELAKLNAATPGDPQTAGAS